MSRDDIAVGLVLGYAADLLLGDPRRGHPVAGFGRVAAALERHTYGPSRGRGVVHEAVLVGGAFGVGALGARAARRGGAPARVGLVAAATWAVLGGRSLTREAEAMGALLAAGDVPGARVRVRNLVGRDPSALGADELARATVESVAENGADAVVSPLFWGAVGGVPGLLAYRAANTLDAMVGHRTPRYAVFGWAAARLDDVANWVPARITVAATMLAAPRRAGAVWRAVRRDAPAHPSPNAGPVEAAFAGALGCSLGGTNTYAGVVEERGRLGEGPAVTVGDLPRATALQTRIGAIALVVILGGRGVVRMARMKRRAERDRTRGL